MLRFTKTVVGLIALLLAGGSVSHAAPVQWSTGDGGNGHYYEVIVDPTGINWWEAKLAAEDSNYLGVNGYLATITSTEENVFVADTMVSIEDQAWIGGFQPLGSPEPDGSWEWVTGETWSYSNWRSGEPNNNGDENALELLSSDHAIWPKVWNDLSADLNINAYVVEYVPEPLTLSLLAVGGLALIHRKRH